MAVKRLVVCFVLVVYLVCACGTPQPTTIPSATPVPPTATVVPPTATHIPPTATSAPPTATAQPPTVTPEPTATSTPTSAPPTATPTDKPAPAAARLVLTDSGQRLGSSRSFDVSLGDLDGDGDLDAFVANDGRAGGSNSVWLNNGGDQGGEPATFSLSEQNLGTGTSVELGDVDGDGDLDALIVDFSDVGTVWLNQGGVQGGTPGTFVGSRQRLGEAKCWDVELGDLDGDGDLDAFFANEQVDKVWLNDGNGTFTDSGQILREVRTCNVELGDLDADGDLDAFVGGTYEPAGVWFNDGQGTFVKGGQGLTASHRPVHGLALGDIDGDGDLDAVVGIASPDPGDIWLNDGHGKFRGRAQKLQSSLVQGLALGDLDGDGSLDVFMAIGDLADSQDLVWLNNGNGTFVDGRLSLDSVYSPDVELGDLDGDGDLDAFVVHGQLWRDSGGGLPNKVWLNETVPSTSVPSSKDTPPSPLSGSGGGVIAFVSGRDGNDEIYVMNADGSDQRNLTNDPAFDTDPIWSPNGAPGGEQIAFSSTRSGNYEIYVMDSDGSNVRRLTDNAAVDANPVWSPDGTQIAFISLRDGNVEIYAVNADGSNLQRLTQNSYNDFEIDWSPDGTQIAVSAQVGAYADIYIINLDGSEQQQLTDTDAHDAFPRWSPDGAPGGEQIAFISNRAGSDKWDIYVMDSDGSNQRQLTYTDAIEGPPSWSPDGTQLAFESDRDGNFEIYVMSVRDGTNVRRLTDNAASNRLPSWRPAETTALQPTATPTAVPSPQPHSSVPGEGDILFSVYPEGDIQVMNADGSNWRMLIDRNISGDISDNRQAVWLPDGKRVSYTIDDFLQAEIWVMQSDGSDRQLVVSGVAPYTAHSWSPDASMVAYVSPQYEINIFNLVDQTITTLTGKSLREERDPDWSPDGSKLVFSASAGVNHDLYVINIDGTGLTRITEHEGADKYPDWSPDGTRIAFSSLRDGDALYDIYVIDLNQGTEENENTSAQLTTGDTLDIYPDWSPDGSRIAYLSHQLGSGHGYISVMDAGGQTHVRLTKDIYYSPKWRPQ